MDTMTLGRAYALFAFLFFALPLFADDCKECAPAKICLAHTAGDDSSITAAALQLKNADPFVRIEGINLMVQAAGKHQNARSKKITAELIRMLADPFGGVKERAGEALGIVGDQATAAQALTAELGRLEKVASGNRPKKPEEEKKWEAALSLTKTMYLSLAQTQLASAVPTFEKAFRGNSPFIARYAAEGCESLKGQKGLVEALIDAMRKWVGMQNPGEGVTDAFFALETALGKVVDDPKKPVNKGGATTKAVMALWDAWWKENDKKYK